MGILHKIIILTFLYWISVIVEILAGLSEITSHIALVVASVAVSASMYLMLDHNEAKYQKFLYVIVWMNLHWICCKWRFIVMDQLNETDHGNESNSIPTMRQKSMFDTIDNSMLHQNNDDDSYEVDMSVEETVSPE